MYFDKLRQQQADFWIRADRLLNFLLLALLVFPLYRQVAYTPMPAWQDPVVWGLLVIAVIAIGEAISLERRRRRWAPAAVLPVVVLAVILIGVWNMHYTTHFWTIAGLALPFTRFRWRTALAVSSAALAASVWIVVYKWQVDFTMGLRSTLSGCLLLVILTVFFRAWEGARAQIEAVTDTLENTLQNITQGVTVFDDRGRVKLFNSQMSRMLNLPEGFLLGQPTLQEIVTFQYQRGDFGTTYELVDESGRDYVASGGGSPVQALRDADKEYTRHTPDGRWLQITTRAMPNGSFVRTYADITDQMEATLQAQQASQAKGQFLANMSHELRTPLSAMIGLMQLLRETPLQPAQHDYLDKIERSGDALLSLINDVLDLSKIESGKMELLPEPFSLETVLQDLGVIAAGYLGNKRLDLCYHVGADVRDRLVGDSMRLRQVLINLMGNAIKFTAHGHVTLSIDAQGMHDGQQRLRFAVTDTGIGLSAEQQQRIFESFSQAEASTARRYGGSGLGLTISQSIVELMGGRLQVQSQPGQGSSFFFEVDMAATDAPQGVAGRVAGSAPAPSVQGARVLIADSDAQRAGRLLALVQAAGVGSATHAEPASLAVAAGAAASPLTAAELLIVHEDDLPSLQAAAADTPRIVLGSLLRPADLSPSPAQRVVRLVKPITAAQMRGAVLSLLQPTTAPAPDPMLMTLAGRTPRNRLFGVRVLVAEDHPINREVAVKVLVREGARVTVAENGRQAVDTLAMGPGDFDLVLMDMQMPEMDGLQATRTLRRELRLRDLPVIAMTANVLGAERDACLDAGMNAHLGKPLRIQSLIDEMQRVAPALLARSRDELGRARPPLQDTPLQGQ